MYIKFIILFIVYFHYSSAVKSGGSMRAIRVFFLVISCAIQVFPQYANFNLNSYKNYLTAHSDMSTQQLLNLFDAGKFKSKISSKVDDAKFLDSIFIKYKITDDEKGLLYRNGFVVTERIKNYDMVASFGDVWRKDLPVFISTDAILNAFHLSYDYILKETEVKYLIPKLKEILVNLTSNLNLLEEKYKADPAILVSLRDLDLYLTVPRYLLGNTVQPAFPENKELLNHILKNISALTLVEEPLFSSLNRKIDYSQFKPRGHYTDSNYPQLANYFKAMIWFGRIELYLKYPVEDGSLPNNLEDERRQILISSLLSELIKISQQLGGYEEFEKIISSFVGEQDNVTLNQLNELLSSVNVQSSRFFLSDTNLKMFQDSLSAKPYADQKILSQVLKSDPSKPEQIKPASAFLLFGQRFVVDSYITSNVVYDRILYNNRKIARMLPSGLDIIFALGNSSAAQLLKSDLDKYNYSTNLSSLRYLINSYGKDFWNLSIYNSWLNGIRSLNPQMDRAKLPEFMQTASYWQQKINTQLASWTQLRHDNLLYAKQSYSGVITCSNPFGYVEPIPEFYSAIKDLVRNAQTKFSGLSIDMTVQKNFFNGFYNTIDTLESIAKKELAAMTLTESEKNFLCSVYSDKSVGCGEKIIYGWYGTRLIYDGYKTSKSLDGNLIVVDVHTSPSDENGAMVGWVKHSGTGNMDMCLVVANLTGLGNVAFIGPVLSYHEYITSNFLRLTDEEWRSKYLSISARPDWTNIYLADAEGKARSQGSTLITDVKQNSVSEIIPSEYKITASNYPNPFNPETLIQFDIPPKYSGELIKLNIYDVQGKQIRSLVNEKLQSGNYIIKWEGRNDFGNQVSSGVYFYQISVNGQSVAGKMNLIK